MVCSVDIYCMSSYNTDHSKTELQNGRISLGRFTMYSINIFFFK